MKPLFPDQCGDCFFQALHTTAPHVLSDLHRRTDDPESIAAWATTWGLDSPVIRDSAARLRHTGSAGPSLRFENAEVVWLVPMDSPEGQWCEAMTRRPSDGFVNCEALPDPRAENLKEWLARARAMYAARERFCFRNGRRPKEPRERRDHTDQFYEWFVRVHVLDMRPSQVAAQVGVDRAAVERETRAVAAQLGWRRRTWPPGKRASRPE